MSLFRPDHYVTGLTALDPLALAESGIRGLLIDIDNTIMARRSGEVPQASAAWIAGALTAGLSVCLLSNNWHDYVHRFADELGVPLVAKALKPLPFGFRAAARALGLRVRQCAVIGDQIFTDVLGGNAAGATSVLVVPLSASDLPHTLVLRRLEQVIMAGRTPAP